MKQAEQGIWILLDSRNTGGIESHVLQLAEGLGKFREKVCVLFLTHYGDHPLREVLQKRGISSRTLDGRFISLWRALRKRPPSILHTHGYKAGIFGRLAARLSRVPVITTYHAGETPTGRLALYDWIDRHTAMLADNVLAVSPQIAQRLPVAAQLADNFIDTSDLDHSTGEQIAFVGRLSGEKGTDYLPLLANRFPERNFHVYGDGPQALELSNQAPNNLYIHGQQDDMSIIWPRIGLLIMPSRHEGLPMAALEAMARSIPVLASRVGALDKLIDSGVNGWLVKPGDIDELAGRLQLWLKMGEQQKRCFKLAAREKVIKQFSADIVVPQLISSYRQISK